MLDLLSHFVPLMMTTMSSLISLLLSVGSNVFVDASRRAVKIMMANFRACFSYNFPFVFFFYCYHHCFTFFSFFRILFTTFVLFFCHTFSSSLFCFLLFCRPSKVSNQRKKAFNQHEKFPSTSLSGTDCVFFSLV